MVVRPVHWTFVSGGGAYEGYRDAPGLGTYPSIEERFDAESAPGLGDDHRYLRAHVNGGFNWLPSPGYSRSGGLLRYSHDQYVPVAGTGGRSFGIARSEFVQHVPVLRETWVLSLRARGESVVHDEGDAPYFLLPWLGSGNTLRAYETARFRDRHALLFSTEWRWMPSRLGMDVAVFADAGQVAAQYHDLGLGRFKKDVGIGIRFHSPTTTALRLEMARGDEGWRFVMATSTPF
jgi:outer membrane protein assembly factor BamA